MTNAGASNSNCVSWKPACDQLLRALDFPFPTVVSFRFFEKDTPGIDVSNTLLWFLQRELEYAP